MNATYVMSAQDKLLNDSLKKLEEYREKEILYVQENMRLERKIRTLETSLENTTTAANRAFEELTHYKQLAASNARRFGDEALLTQSSVSYSVSAPPA